MAAARSANSTRTFKRAAARRCPCHIARSDYFSATAQDGRLFRISTFVELRCLDGDTRRPAVTINAGRDGFRTEGDHVLVYAELPWAGDAAFTHHLRVDARRDGARLSGTVDDFVTRTGASGQVCSGRVAFSAHE